MRRDFTSDCREDFPVSKVLLTFTPNVLVAEEEILGLQFKLQMTSDNRYAFLKIHSLGSFQHPGVDSRGKFPCSFSYSSLHPGIFYSCMEGWFIVSLFLADACSFVLILSKLEFPLPSWRWLVCLLNLIVINSPVTFPEWQIRLLIGCLASMLYKVQKCSDCLLLCFCATKEWL